MVDKLISQHSGVEDLLVWQRIEPETLDFSSQSGAYDCLASATLLKQHLTLKLPQEDIFHGSC